MSNPAQFAADLKDLSDKAEVDYVNAVSNVTNNLRKALEIRIAIGNLELQLKTAIATFEQQMRVIEDNYAKK